MYRKFKKLAESGIINLRRKLELKRNQKEHYSSQNIFHKFRNCIFQENKLLPQLVRIILLYCCCRLLQCCTRFCCRNKAVFMLSFCSRLKCCFEWGCLKCCCCECFGCCGRCCVMCMHMLRELLTCAAVAVHKMLYVLCMQCRCRESCFYVLMLLHCI